MATERTLIESDNFPFDFLSDLAEVESWRKEIYRPIYHVHKWWATRLGSVFRGIILACVKPPGVNFESEFYQLHDLKDCVVFDPFMGSGTTIGEAHKLGCTAVGRDINPVAVETASVALGPIDKSGVIKGFQQLDHGVGQRIRALYKAPDTRGIECDVLYYFWVKFVHCPKCAHRVDLFSSFVMARHADPERSRTVQVVCPGCGDVFPSMRDTLIEVCPTCATRFNPQEGAARGVHALCSKCRSRFPIAQTIRSTGAPPSHRLYAKLLLRHSGDKVYLRTTQEDDAAYERASGQLEHEHLRLPELEIADGHNTRQVLNYGYRRWRDFFNDRQLLALGLLHRALWEIENTAVRDPLLSVFSSALEFNNLFTSYKGEGTGAVRHMFSHHILKPERAPIEANLWGTEKSSGAFSGLFKRRLLQCIEYRERPFEVSSLASRMNSHVSKVFGCSPPFEGRLHAGEPSPNVPGTRSVFLSCGSSHRTTLSEASVDFVVTDPPFFDNVHYSELADFFYAWQQLSPTSGQAPTKTSRQEQEVQDTDSICFARKLEGVFQECCRVLKDSGLLVFTYHHSRHDGWISVGEAAMRAGFRFVNAHPVKSEMSVATPKTQAKEPIDIDIILVCRKSACDTRIQQDHDAAWSRAMQKSRAKAAIYLRKPRRFSQNDMRVLVTSQLLVELSAGRTAPELSDALAAMAPDIETTTLSLLREVEGNRIAIERGQPRHRAEQLRLFA